MAKKQDISEEKRICGIIMPISSIDGCSESHWSDVLDIISDAIELAGFEPNLVSNADDVGVIQKRIIQNLYENPIVVCDVSGKNPNVMFELGMRLAFDRPAIIIKDDKTPFSFDTSPIEHLEYPRDLRFQAIVDFKEQLTKKIKKTYDASVENSEYTTFLKHFGEFKVAKLDTKEVSRDEYILDELRSLRLAISRLYRRQLFHALPIEETSISFQYDIKIKDASDVNLASIASVLSDVEGVVSVEIKDTRNGIHLIINGNDDCNINKLKNTVRNLLPDGSFIMRRRPTIRST